MARKKVLAGYTLWIGGIDYVGVVAGFTPPEITAETATSNMPGHAGPFEIHTGRLEALEATVSMDDQYPALEALAASPASIDTDVLFLARSTDGGSGEGAATRDTEYLLAGQWTKQARSEFGGAEGEGGSGGGACTYTISVRRMRHLIDGALVREIDFERNVHVAGGVDVTGELRERLRTPSQGARFS